MNKVYGTPTLASGDVVDAVHASGGALRFREVDTVAVKGKAIGIKMFTPCEDEALIAMSDVALAAWREGHFDVAKKA